VSEQTPLGRIDISPTAIASIAARTVTRTALSGWPAGTSPTALSGPCRAIRTGESA
jgi:hypothetical protein